MTGRAKWIIAAIAGSAVLMAVAALSPRLRSESHTVITIDPTETYQTMTGWEATARLWEIDKVNDRFDNSWERYGSEIFDRMVNELGVNRVRIEIKSGAENPVDYWQAFVEHKIGYKEFRRHFYEKINDNADPQVERSGGFQFSHLDYQVAKIVLPIKRLLEAKGERLYVNLNYVDFGQTELKGDLSHALNPDEYAELILAAFSHLKDRYDLVPDALEIVLEPDNTDHWRGAEIGRAIATVTKQLKASGFSPEIIAPSTATAANAAEYIEAMMKIPGVAAAVSSFSYHRYDGGPSNALRALAHMARTFGVRTEMLEHTTGDAVELYDDLTLANASAWQQYGIACKSLDDNEDEESCYYVVNVSRRDKPVLKMAVRARALASYFCFIRAGAVRIGTRSDISKVRSVAFRNVDGSHVVIIQASRAAALSISGLPSATYRVRHTTDRELFHELPAVAVATATIATATVPEPGIVTVFASGTRQHCAAGARRP